MKSLWQKQVECWQRAIALEIGSDLLQMGNSAHLAMVQPLILGPLYLFLAEQRGLFPAGQLQQISEGDRIIEQLIDLQSDLGDRFPGLPTLALPQAIGRAVVDSLLRSIIQHLDAFAQGAMLPVELLGQTYELLVDGVSSIPVSSSQQRDSISPRKTGGVYYTPAPVVNYVVEQTLGRIMHSAIPQEGKRADPMPRIIDPTCGGGAFLLAAYQFLLQRRLANCLEDAAAEPEALYQDATGQWHLTWAERVRLLQSCIYGVDIDRQAIAITQLTLVLKLLENVPEPGDCLLPDLNHPIQQGNALSGAAPFDALDTQAAQIEPFLNWQTAFPEVLQAGGFEVVMGNPPYLDAEIMMRSLPHWRRYCTSHYRTATGNWDIFCVFIEKALTLCRPGGWVSLVVPNKLLSADYAAMARSLLLQENQLHGIRDYSQVPVFAASVYPLVFIAQAAKPPAQSSIRYEVMSDLEQVNQVRCLPYPDSEQSCTAPWLMASAHMTDVLTHLRQHPPLAALAQVLGAATVGEAYQLQPFIQDQRAIASGDLQMVNSGTIDRYCLLWGEKPMRYLRQAYQHPVIPIALQKHLPPKRYQQSLQPKLIVAGLSQRLECAPDFAGTVLAGKSTSIILPRPAHSIDLRYLLGVLNSELIHRFFSLSFGGNRLKGGYLRVGPPQLRQLPICLPASHPAYQQQYYEQIIQLVDQRLVMQTQQSTRSPLTGIDHQIDRLVYTLYGINPEDLDQ